MSVPLNFASQLIFAISWFIFSQSTFLSKKLRFLRECWGRVPSALESSLHKMDKFATMSLWSERTLFSCTSMPAKRSSLLVYSRSRMLFNLVGSSTNCVRKWSFAKLIKALWEEPVFELFVASPFKKVKFGKFISPVKIIDGYDSRLFMQSSIFFSTCIKYWLLFSGGRYTVTSKTFISLIYIHRYSIIPSDPEVSSLAETAISLRM